MKSSLIRERSRKVKRFLEIIEQSNNVLSLELHNKYDCLRDAVYDLPQFDFCYVFVGFDITCNLFSFFVLKYLFSILVYEPDNTSYYLVTTPAPSTKSSPVPTAAIIKDSTSKNMIFYVVIPVAFFLILACVIVLFINKK